MVGTPPGRCILFSRFVALAALVGTIFLAPGTLGTWENATSAKKRSPFIEGGSLLREYGDVPLPFEPNRGQAPSSVRFLARGSAYLVYLGVADVTFVPTRSRRGGEQDGALVRMKLLGAEPGSGTIEYSVEENSTGQDRTGFIRISGKSYTVQQLGTPCTFELSNTSENFYGRGGVGRVEVRASGRDCQWTVRSDVPWIRILRESGVGSGTVSFSVDANPTGRQRSGTITIAGLPFTVFDWVRQRPRE